jgi:hypothetical protein
MNNYVYELTDQLITYCMLGIREITRGLLHGNLKVKSSGSTLQTGKKNCLDYQVRLFLCHNLHHSFVDPLTSYDHELQASHDDDDDDRRCSACHTYMKVLMSDGRTTCNSPLPEWYLDSPNKVSVVM